MNDQQRPAEYEPGASNRSGDQTVSAGAPKLLLDVTEVANILGLGRSHVYSYILRGELRSLKLGRRRKVPVESVRDFIEKLQREEDASSY